jgi:hypothetical protein
MGHNLSTLEHFGALVVTNNSSADESANVSEAATPKKAAKVAAVETLDLSDTSSEERVSLWRTRVLLVRSVLSATGILVSQLSNFSHPYIPRMLSAALVLEGLSAAQSQWPSAECGQVREDVDRCLSTVATKIPARLSVPLLLQCAPKLLGAGHSAASRFADLLAEVWQQLDRPTVVAHLPALSTLATLLLDYRRVFGDQSAASGEVDAAAADAVVELCLKLTETELKSFLVRLAEWRDVRFASKKKSHASEGSSSSSDAVDWRTYSRAVSYYALTDALMGKLQSLFIPIMGVLWSNTVEILRSFAEHAASANSKKSAKDSASGSKARKFDEMQESSSSSDERRLLSELQLLVGYVLHSVRECCTQDSVGFVDEVFQKWHFVLFCFVLFCFVFPIVTFVPGSCYFFY